MFNDYKIYQKDLLIHSVVNFWPLINEILLIIQPNSICEIGVEGAIVTEQILEYCKQRQVRYLGIEPSPNNNVQKLINTGQAEIRQQLSLDVLKSDLKSDFIIVDGDHNYYTVYHELKLIFEQAESKFVILHDVSWPCDRRDLYYSPSSIPSESLHPYSYEKGVSIHKDELINGGFSGGGHFALALDNGGERNGVLTAVEDYLKTNSDLEFFKIESVFGLGIMYAKSRLNYQQIEGIYTFINKIKSVNYLLYNLEYNRLNLYLDVLQKQELINSQQTQIKSKEAEINNLRNSRSWKITQPLRIMKDRIFGKK